MKTLIVGLGNPILTDDGVGVRVALAVERLLNDVVGNDITVAEASVGGLRLMEMMIGYDRVILIDALIRQNMHRPGAIRRLTLQDLRSESPTQHSASAHDASLVTALDVGHCLGFPLPEEVIIYGIEVENVTDFSDEPTPAVAAAIPAAIEAVLAEIHNKPM